MDIASKVKKAKKGDEQSFYELILSVKESLYRTAYRYFGNEHDALDAVQEVTCRAFLKLQSLRQPDYFKPWIIRMMINHCNDVWKKRSKMIPVQQIYEKGIQENITDQLILEELLTVLDPNLQEIIHLKYFEDWTIRQIATWKRVPEGTVKTWLSRALNTLRLEWERGEKKHVL
jgi:RNA polymerase sigma factor (sigma-70 family)